MTKIEFESRESNKVFMVEYKGSLIPFTQIWSLVSENNYEIDGYSHECHICKERVYLNAHRHTVEIDGDKLTASPSLVCPFKCGAHVWLKNGIMTDC